MPTIRVRDLAAKMAISQQDLIFKLRSIGIQVDSADADVDMELLQAVLQGKKVVRPGEVIMDDGAAPAAGRPAAVGPAGAAAPRRAGANPLRPQRPRTIIQRAEARIVTLPTADAQGPSAGSQPAPDSAPSASEPSSAVPGRDPAVNASIESAEQASPPPTSAPGAIAQQSGGEGSSLRPTSGSSPVGTGARSATLGAGGRQRAVLIHRPTEPYGAGSPGTSGRPPRPGTPTPGGRPGDGGTRRPPQPGRDRPSRPGGTERRPPASRGPGALNLRNLLPPTPPPAGPRGTGGRRPGPGPTPAERKAKKRTRKTLLAPAENDRSILSLRGGTLELIEEVVDESVVPTGSVGRRRRRTDEIDEIAEAQALQPTRSVNDGPVVISEGMTVRTFAERLGVRARDLIQLLFNRGIMATINHVLDPKLAIDITRQLGFEPQVMSFEEEIRAKDEAAATSQIESGASAGRVPRAPIVTIMGHVDHGKTSLLDRIRTSRLVDEEFGGITQHIGAYHVEVNDRKIVFLDTPGHEAFTLMRARGARVTDVVILVVAADDGVMPQTIEAISHARDAGVPIVVAINKIDKANANVERVMRQLAEQNLTPEDWGGETVVVPVSAHTGSGIQQLLEMILLVADMKGLTADPDLAAQGTILEARKETGRGVVATVLVQNGTLRVGDVFVAGSSWGRVRSMQDDLGHRVLQAPPSTAVEVTGFEELPAAGDTFQVVDTEQKARTITEFRQDEARRTELQPGLRLPKLEDFFESIQRGEKKTLKIILKTDVRGSAEVLHKEIEKLSTPKVRVMVILSGVGAISTNDVNLARAAQAIIVGFNVRPERNAAELAEKEQVDIRLHTVIYEVLTELQNAMLGQLEPIFRETFRGRAEVREIFRVRKVGTVAGCHVVEGTVPRNATVRLVRDGTVIHEGTIGSLKRFKDDASEVRAGYDCGIALEQFQDVKPGDVIEAFVKEKVAPSLV